MSAIDFSGRTLWIVDAHRDDGKRFVAQADGKGGLYPPIERTSADHNRGDGKRSG